MRRRKRKTSGNEQVSRKVGTGTDGPVDYLPKGKRRLTSAIHMLAEYINVLWLPRDCLDLLDVHVNRLSYLVAFRYKEMLNPIFDVSCNANALTQPILQRS